MFHFHLFLYIDEAGDFCSRAELLHTVLQTLLYNPERSFLDAYKSTPNPLQDVSEVGVLVLSLTLHTVVGRDEGVGGSVHGVTLLVVAVHVSP